LANRRSSRRLASPYAELGLGGAAGVIRSRRCVTPDDPVSSTILSLLPLDSIGGAGEAGAVDRAER